MSGQLYFSEMAGSGAALFDADNDGDLDVFLVQGGPLGAENVGGPSDRLYRNDMAQGRAVFTDITEASGLDSRGYGMGVAAGDVDNDGRTDLYVTNFGENQLWLNTTEGFTEVTTASGPSDPRWSTSAAFLDFDRDGWLDLYVVTYVDFRLTNHKICDNDRGAPDYCGPRSYRPEPDRLFRNLGLEDEVAFEDVTVPAGIGAPGPGLGVVTADFNDDGWVDIYVANDEAHNHLWMNRGDGTFRDEALMRGAAVDAQGRPQASMGVDAADVDGDGDTDLFMTHLLAETNTLYLNDGQGIFTERTVASGLAAPSLSSTGFGTVFLDLDNDSRLDLLAVNGEVRIIPEQQAAGEALPLKQPNQLFRNEMVDGALRFADWSARAPVLALPNVSRGAAVGDVDNDGDVDVVVLNNNGPVQLLINRIGSENAWLGLRLVGEGGRDMLGTRVALLRDDAPPLWRQARTDASYLSANDPRVLFGLGDDSRQSYSAEVLWPSGRRERFQGLEPGRYQDLVEGEGEPL